MSLGDLAKIFDEGVSLYQKGLLSEAEQRCIEILKKILTI